MGQAQLEQSRREEACREQAIDQRKAASEASQEGFHEIVKAQLKAAADDTVDSPMLPTSSPPDSDEYDIICKNPLGGRGAPQAQDAHSSITGPTSMRSAETLRQREGTV